MARGAKRNVGLLLLHALPLDGSMWSRFFDLLPESTFAPTLYGFGNSLQDWAEGSLSVSTTDRLIVVGCSVGGSCALEIAAIAPERVEALVLIGTKADHRPDPNLRVSAIRTLENKGIKEAWTAHWEPLFGNTTDQAVIEEGKRIAMGRSVSEIARGVSVFHSRPSRGKFAASCSKKTIVVTGEYDIAPGLDSSAALAMSMPNARCDIIRESGHYVPLEQPEALRSILKELIAAK